MKSCLKQAGCFLGGKYSIFSVWPTHFSLPVRFLVLILQLFFATDLHLTLHHHLQYLKAVLASTCLTYGKTVKSLTLLYVCVNWMLSRYYQETCLDDWIRTERSQM